MNGFDYAAIRRDVPAIVAAYLNNWSRRGENRDDKLPFEDRVLCAMVVRVYAALIPTLSEGRARRLAAWDARRTAEAVIKAGGTAANIGAAALPALASQGLNVEDLMKDALESGSSPSTTLSLVDLTWRVAFLGVVVGHERPAELSALEEKVARSCVLIDEQDARRRASNVSAASRVALALAQIHRDDTQACALRLVRMCREQRDDLRELVTPHLAQLACAAQAAGASGVYDDTVAVLHERIDQDRFLLRADQEASGRLDATPWAPWALSGLLAGSGALDDVFDPPAPPLPPYVLTSTEANDALAFCVQTGNETVVRAFDSSDFDRILRQLPRHLPDELSARLHGHAVIGMLDLLPRCTDPQALQFVRDQAERSLGLVMNKQGASGGWPYARRSQSSIVYVAGGARETVFPDLEYTIDTAVPGIALARAFKQWGRPEYLDAAQRGVAFLEERIGRIDWRGRPVWRLFPEDEKTRRMGTAVNYELWLGAFFAALAAVTHDERLRKRLDGYVDDTVAYAESHLRPSGDIEYGDYVSELRTPYASWDALLLAEIARDRGHAPARALSQRIVHRLAEVMQPSGAIPNVPDYAEDLGGMTRWRVHRHGTGPYPVRSYYQLYFVAAAASSGVELDAARRALGHVLVDMYSPVFSDMSPGRSARGESERHADDLWRVGRDWMLTVAGLLPQLGFDYSPSVAPDTDAATRLRTALCAAIGALSQRADDDDKDVTATLDEATALLDGESPDFDLRGLYRSVRAAWAEEHSGSVDDLPIVTCDEMIAVGLSTTGIADAVRRLERAQRASGLVRFDDAPEGDQRQALILLALAALGEEGGQTTRGLLVSAAEGSWNKLFHRRQGTGYARPGRDGMMSPMLAAVHACVFAEVARVNPDRVVQVRARTVLRSLFMQGAVPAGPLDIQHAGAHSDRIAAATLLALCAVWRVVPNIAEVNFGTPRPMGQDE